MVKAHVYLLVKVEKVSALTSENREGIITKCEYIFIDGL